MNIVDLLSILAKRHKEKTGIPANKTKLIKLAYLTEIYYKRLTGEKLTEQKWIYWKYGPYFFEYEDIIENTSIFMKPDKSFDFYPIEIREDYEIGITNLNENTALFYALEHASDDLNNILDFIYYDTEPMINVVKRGDILNFDLVLPQEFYVVRKYDINQEEGKNIIKKIREWEKNKGIVSKRNC